MHGILSRRTPQLPSIQSEAASAADRHISHHHTKTSTLSFPETRDHVLRCAPRDVLTRV